LLVYFACLAWAFLMQADPQAAGQQALDKHDYALAEQIFTKLAAGNPKDYAARFNLALAEAGLNKDDQAIDHLKQTLALQPNLYQAEINLGVLYLRDKRGQDAVSTLDAAVRAKPDAPKPHLYLGQALALTSKWPEAAAQFGEVLKRDPSNARAELGLGECLLHEGRLDESKPHYEKAVALDPTLKPYLLELAIALSDASRPGDAAPLLKQFPDDAGAREKLGEIYLSDHKAADAVPQFEAAARLSPTPANRLALATAYLRNNEEDKAAPLLKQALAANPDDYNLQITVGRLYRDRKNYAQAENYLYNAAKLKPDSPEPWSELAGIYTVAQQYQQGLAALDRLRQMNAEKPGHFYLRAIILDKLHQVKPALASYRRFLQLSHGENPDQEFQARGRVKVLEHQLNGR
jgi:tetratricopeptide (TPR) repeat protein